MKPGSLVFSIIIGALLIGCAGNEMMLDQSGPPPAASDMFNILGNNEPSQPYSRYIYKIVGKDGGQPASGVISMSPLIEQDLRLVVAGSKLKVIADQSFISSHDLQIGASEEVPFRGGYSAGGRLAIMPGLFRPAEFQPQWFPWNAVISVDSKCNFLIKLKNPQGTEVQKLVAFIDARTKFDRTHCEFLGTFQNILQLEQLVADLVKQGEYNGRRSYVLRLNWSDTFALIKIIREGEK
ncbi:MAG: hypothetical protein H6Q52_2528 [Deltaproteobacteria bacterium]|nr:hypothetical protein [Deltaproteobacteria bacterium]